MAKPTITPHRNQKSTGPNFDAPLLWARSEHCSAYPIDDEDQALLASISTIARFRKGDCIYREGERPAAAYNIVSGVVKATLKKSPETSIVGFFFPRDIFGLALDGRYCNSAEAVTPVTVYKMPSAALESKLRRNPRLEFDLICKLCHELRESQRHALLLTRRHAISRVAFFLQFMEAHENLGGDMSGAEFKLPMSRKDIAGYVGVSPEAVGRAFRQLEALGLVRIRDKKFVRILDHAGLEVATSE